MAKDTAEAPEVPYSDAPIPPPSADEWETVAEAEGDPWKPDAPGDALIGVYADMEPIEFTDEKGETKRFNVYRVRDDKGHLWSLGSTWKLDQIMSDVTPGDRIKLEYVGDLDMGPGRNPMHDFRLLRAKR